MSLNLNEYERQLIEELSVMSGIPNTTVRDVLKYLLFINLDAYCKKEPIRLPFLGKVHIKYEGDEFVENSRKAKVSIFASPSDLLLRLVGEIEDGESDLLDDLMKKEIRTELKKIIEKG